MIEDHNKRTFDDFLANLSPSADKEYSLSKTTRRFKRSFRRIPPLKDDSGSLLRNHKEKVEFFARHLSQIFVPHNIQSNFSSVITPKPDEPFRLITPLEVESEIDKLKMKKALGADKITTSNVLVKRAITKGNSATDIPLQCMSTFRIYTKVSKTPR